MCRMPKVIQDINRNGVFRYTVAVAKDIHGDVCVIRKNGYVRTCVGIYDRGR